MLSMESLRQRLIQVLHLQETPHIEQPWLLPLESLLLLLLIIYFIPPALYSALGCFG